ncbi:LysR substrate-binding domain-containing protein [Pseudomonas sp. CC120222-01a]|uniref:LysR substrate-binding domain-containing protein n=1 Tax=Pseudomonas sp. CC120222-01a TaxID=1378075 RepID=UPI000D88A5D4|nr:LysR substrate-binding domain-containing protein [Pseudomonas sp. CC120222-01a]PVZ41180.1 DNA-binding transcriptional LysR family regulator [Pseudomonas sp. CC120222-01a]
MKTKETVGKYKGYRRIIPSMTALLQFEAVARLRSFTQAASELGVTQAAVSKQIKLLEDNICAQLFYREHRGIRLSHEGQRLFDVISGSMQKIATVYDGIREGEAAQEIVLTTTAAFSQLRIMPRLTQLHVSVPGVQLRLATQLFVGELRNRDVDVVVRYGNGVWEDGRSEFLFNEEVFPVCAPLWLDRRGPVITLDELAEADLLDAEVTKEGWMTWQGWFKEQGVVSPKLHYSLRCNLYTDTIQAALHGHGVALGWGRLLDYFLDSGQLVRLTTFVVKPRDAYYIVVPHGRIETASTRALIEWLREPFAVEK